MGIESVVSNELVADASGVYVLKGHKEFGYSDGAGSERFLTRALAAAQDLSTTSTELESCSVDWASEYHLTTKRAQLLAGLKFDRSARVLEVGCGCGAITRWLGESFDHVVSVEGSIHRARIARLRTRDLPGVSIICSPFQSIRFSEKFDVVFCIGVLEYSGAFIGGEDPYGAAIDYFADILAPDGLLVVAIENQFGLKYFTCSREDHVGRMYEGIEGYHRQLGNVRTFGRVELEALLKRKFPYTWFYYPYPDYKLPDAVLSEPFLADGRAAELVSQLRSRDYFGELRPAFDESLAALELGRNGALPFFSNSFLVVAAKSELARYEFGQLGTLCSPPRRPPFRTYARIVDRGAEGVVIEKSLRAGGERASRGRLRIRATRSRWIDGRSLHTLLTSGARSSRGDFEGIFAPCRVWAEALRNVARAHAGSLPADHLDAIWTNAYVVDGRCVFIDLEWEWDAPIPLNVVAIRAIFRFLASFEAGRVPEIFRGAIGRALINRVGAALGFRFSAADFESFISIESEFQELAYGVPRGRTERWMRWYLRNPSVLRSATRLGRLVRRARMSATARLGGVARRLGWAQT